MKKITFFFHYNKPKTLATGTPYMSLHFNDKCELITKIECNVPIKSKINKNSPRIVMKGKANDIVIVDDVENITAFIF